MDKSEELELVMLSQQGDKEAFCKLINCYQLPMYRTALGIVGDTELAKDVVQDGFLKVWEELNSYDPRYKFYSWLYKIIVNKSLNSIRNNNRSEPFTDGESTLQNPYQELVREEENVRLLHVLSSLPGEYSLIVLLRHFEELSYKEIAGILEIDEKTVKSRLYSARVKIREQFFLQGDKHKIS